MSPLKSPNAAIEPSILEMPTSTGNKPAVVNRGLVEDSQKERRVKKINIKEHILEKNIMLFCMASLNLSFHGGPSFRYAKMFVNEEVRIDSKQYKLYKRVIIFNIKI